MPPSCNMVNSWVIFSQGSTSSIISSWLLNIRFSIADLLILPSTFENKVACKGSKKYVGFPLAAAFDYQFMFG